MEDTTIYRFIKKIIENGIRSNLSVTKIEEAIDTLLNNLKSQNLIPSEEISTLLLLKKYLPLILKNTITIDEAYIQILKMKLMENRREKTFIEEPKTYTIGSCLREREISSSRCAASSSYSDSCGNSKQSSNSNSCYSSSSSCGSSRTSGRC